MLEEREEKKSMCYDFVDKKNNPVTSLVVRDTIRIRSMDKMCLSMTIMCMPIDKLSSALNPWKKLSKLSLKNKYESIYFDHFQNNENYYKDKFTRLAFERLTSFLVDPRQRLVLPFSPTIMKVMFTTDSVNSFNITVIRENEVVTNKMKNSKNILFSVTNSASCKDELENYDFELIPYKNAQLSKDDILKKFQSADDILQKAVTEFIAPITDIEQVVFLELRKKDEDECNDENSEEEEIQDKFSAPVTNYITYIPSINTQLLEHVNVVKSCINDTCPIPTPLNPTDNSKSSYSMMYALIIIFIRLLIISIIY